MLPCVRGKSQDKREKKRKIGPNVLILSQAFCVIGWVGYSVVKQLHISTFIESLYSTQYSMRASGEPESFKMIRSTDVSHDQPCLCAKAAL